MSPGAATASAYYVCFGSQADMTTIPGDVRFTPESGHSPTRSGCLLWAAISTDRRNTF
jgi:hypothetical protein